MKRFILAGALLVTAPVAVLLPGCGGGSGNVAIPTSTPTRATPIATSTAKPTSTPAATPAVGTANISFVASTGVYFGSSPYSVSDIEPLADGNDLIIGFATPTTGNDFRYFTLSIRHTGAIQNAQTFSLQSGGSTFVASAPSSAGSSNYVSYGGTGFTIGSVKVARSGNIATFTLQNVAVRNNGLNGPGSGSLTFNATITVTLPPSMR